MLFIWYLRETHDCVNNSHITLKAGKNNKKRTCIGKRHWKWILPLHLFVDDATKQWRRNCIKVQLEFDQKAKQSWRQKMIKQYILLAWGIKTEQRKLLKQTALKKITSTRSIFVSKTVLFTLWEAHTVSKRLKNKHYQATATQNCLGFYTFIFSTHNAFAQEKTLNLS